MRSRKKRMQSDNFYFPILKQKDVLSCMKEMKIPLSRDNIENPRGVDIQRILLQVLQRYAGFDVEKLLKTEVSSLETTSRFSHPPLHTTGVQVHAIFVEASKMMSEMGYDGLSFQTLVNPEQRDVVVLCSCVINFAKFREVYGKQLNDIQEEKFSLRDRHKRVEKETARLSDDVARFQRQEEKNRKLKEKLEKKNQESGLEVMRLQQDLFTLMEGNKKQTRRMAMAKGQVEQKISHGKKMENQVQAMEFQITENPPQLRETLRSLNAEESTRVNAIRNASIKCNDLCERVNQVENCIQMLGNPGERFQRLATMKNEGKMLVGKVKNKEEKNMIERTKGLVGELTREINERERCFQDEVKRIHGQICLMHKSLDNYSGKLKLKMKEVEGVV